MSYVDQRRARSRISDAQEKKIKSSHTGRQGKHRCPKCGEPFDRYNRYKNHVSNCKGTKVYGRDLDGNLHSALEKRQKGR